MGSIETEDSGVVVEGRRWKNGKTHLLEQHGNQKYVPKITLQDLGDM